MARHRVAVTGLGCITPVGCGMPETWSALIEGRAGITPISFFDATGYPSSIAGEAQDFDPLVRLSSKDARKMDRFVQLGVVAGLEAYDDAGLNGGLDKDRFGILIGAGIGGLETIEKTTSTLLEKGPRRVSPFYIPSSIINMVSGNLSIMLDAQGPNLAIATACTTGTHSIGMAARLIQYGEATVMIAGGTESSITPTSMAGFGAAKALSRRNHDPTRASRPWDIERDGFVLGEGAGTMVLEELEHAKARGARIYAELTGFGMSGDAHHMTQPSTGGEGASRCMAKALSDGCIDSSEIDYINAHGTSTPQGDLGETLAIKRTFGPAAYELMISSNKSMLGHLLGAAGGVEAVATVLSLYHGVIPPTINLETPDPDCDLDYVPGTAREVGISTALSNSFGFGGTNGTLVFRRYLG
ncbi:MAG TPA: beta-ketoacyl-[acyl-carrier-protein] synthase II [Gammaproteobacteria bacterium]|nr:beta-ketoacyl-ACP synthase II [Gammaproteobacteria bacterium]HAD36147.1 beta-ketoacyl-[acyl-carrier-protein] synthase II [Gammaproteobacteria bacterium]HBK77333.1 beta-ketoacyl-[acyl-carrier-protein] synthase II [Gammaproteobacteria bacterium]HIA41370.1 beta-ketoacyl-[acyl-carrier-protein] synthase II [Gammaproteobacteria bacterium]HIB80763.1 beta-ketoacyl-[acyl-carrier-protein] synthase II [Gammaproteobacteria bacterium]